MKKLIGTIFILFTIYYLYEFLFIYFQGGHNIKYEVGTKKESIMVSEKLASGVSDGDNYEIEINVDGNTFNILTFYNFYRSNKVISLVKYENDGSYACVFVKYRNDTIINDVLCKKDGVQQYYHSISNPSSKLKDFVSSLEQYGYNEKQWSDSSSEAKKLYDYTLYKNNLIDNHFVAFNTDGGFFRVNKIDVMSHVSTFALKEHKYAKLYTFIDKYYLYYDYTTTGGLMFILKNVHNKGESVIAGGDLVISKYSYILGIHNKSIYIFDPTTNKEYEIDISVNRILEVGNEKTGYAYFSGGKQLRTSLKNVKENMFGDLYDNDYKNDKYEIISKFGNEYGYYYLYKKNHSGYSVYRSSIKNRDAITYLFDVSSVNTMIRHEDYIYYIDGDNIKYYSDSTGERTLLQAHKGFINTVKLGLYVK